MASENLYAPYFGEEIENGSRHLPTHPPNRRGSMCSHPPPRPSGAHQTGGSHAGVGGKPTATEPCPLHFITRVRNSFPKPEWWRRDFDVSTFLLLPANCVSVSALKRAKLKWGHTRKGWHTESFNVTYKQMKITGRKYFETNTHRGAWRLSLVDLRYFIRTQES